ncbi:MAG: cytochrome P450 [Mycobacteriales bacterium]
MTATALPTYPWMDLNRHCPLDPPPLLAALRAEGPPTRVHLAMGMDAWLVTRYADARFVLSDRRFSADRRRDGFPHVGPPRPVPPGNFVHIDPPEHTRLRRLVARNFTARTVEALRPRIQGFVDEIVDGLAAGAAGPPPVDLKEALAVPLPVRVISELVGVPRADAGRFTRATTLFMPTTTPPDGARERVAEVMEWVNGLVLARKREPADDLISRLVAEKESTGECTHEELVGLTVVLMFGGYETIANTLGLALVLLLRHPDQLAAIRSGPELVPDAVEEVLRYVTVVHTGLPRLAMEDVEVGGQLVRAGEGVVVSLAAADRDPAEFDDPDRFDVRRFGGRRELHHLAFGYGPHQCIGQMLARAQLQAVIGTLFRRLPGLRLAVPFEELPFRHDMFLYGLHRLPVTW